LLLTSPGRAARGPLRIVVADDAMLLREGLVRLLAEDGHQFVAAVDDGPALVEAVLRHRPDVSVVDVRMPPTHTDEGLRAAIAARSRLPQGLMAGPDGGGTRVGGGSLPGQLRRRPHP
jgi:CheY-like chemotaxis protein